MRHFELPKQEELDKIGIYERMNVFRRYLAFSRYNRLVIQQSLIMSALDKSYISKVKELEESNNRDFFDTLKKIKCYGYADEFLVAVREEIQALQKITDTYEKRMDQVRY
ncbi:MAG: hypothetical protein JO297_11685 [Nitrososphaeraceae archaeon]|nr:hypothetical protein [Nitrososphaeraceae archaeon]